MRFRLPMRRTVFFLAAFRARAEAGGIVVEGGNLLTSGGRPTAELVLRPA